MKEKGFLIFLFIAFAIFYLMNFVIAFGVGSSYWNENPLYMKPGETKDISLTLQNMVGNEDVTLRATLVNGSNIAILADDNLDYLIPFGTEGMKVNLKINIPENAVNGTKYKVAVFFKEVVADEGKMMQMAGGIEKSFPVIVEEGLELPEGEREKITSKNLFWIITIIIVLLVIYFIVRGVKKK